VILGGGLEGKVIKPPIEPIMAGKVFRPSRKFRNKMWVELILVALTLYVLILACWLPIAYVVVLDNGGDFVFYLDTFLMPVNIGYWVFTTIWLVPALILTPLYIKSIEYSIIKETGEALSAIYVKKGLINITRKHCPFYAITNIASRVGPLDRLFGIGAVHVETAGFSGSSQMGPEESIEGVVFYNELRDAILRELRKFKTPYVTGTEAVMPSETPVQGHERILDREMLKVLREIRNILEEKIQ
jgi:membrane protein YdbS with pleckstrin-like domain